jgi:hypothetical protein
MDEIFYVDRKYCLVTVVCCVLTICMAPSYLRKALPGFFLWIFSSSLTCLKKPVFTKRDVLRWKVPARLLYWDLLASGRYQLGCCTGIFWPAEGTSQAVTISKKWKNPSSALRRTRTCVQALLLYLVATNVPYLCSYLDRRWWMRLITLFPCLPIIPYMLVLRFL